MASCKRTARSRPGVKTLPYQAHLDTSAATDRSAKAEIAESGYCSRCPIEYVTRNVTGDRVDGYMGMPMHRGLGPHLRGVTPTIRGLGTLASPRTFGHGGVGTSYAWADPESGVSFAYISNSRNPDPWHSARLDVVSNLVHAAID